MKFLFGLLMMLVVSLNASEKEEIYYGNILSIKNVMGYKYLKVDEKGKELWVAIANAPVKVGDMIGYDKQTIMKDFTSKSLGKTFKEIIFANDVYLPEPKQEIGMKGLLGMDKDTKKAKYPKEVKKKVAPSKPFVKKELYTVEDIHMYADELKGQVVSLKVTITKVSHQIMKLDWVHVSDKTGNHSDHTDDLVFTAKTTSIKIGDEVIATGKVVVEKDFGYGYFYKVIIEESSFK